ncbi:uncharacterized protein LOC133839559 [Drosophila sulfurigaster albostrigata]|uniref:uncharacterized protein LOC133839559 n=1 Tax=Drosophila sulfurigaster albostrigata TaxID=89887 RepID=UPI002D21B347|nr:uncharacterized protein LOC133839559 [Drosophila sulfurigaster albostrigata]
MQDNESMARGFAKGDRVAAEAKWSELAGALNAIGPPIKDVAGWKKVWCDWKANIRKKIAQNKAEVRATGGGPYCQQPLTAMEKDVAKLCGLFEMVDGVGAVAYGAPTTIIEEEVAKEEPSRKRRRTAAEVHLQSLCVAQVEEMKLINSTMSKHFQKW